MEFRNVTGVCADAHGGRPQLQKAFRKCGGGWPGGGKRRKLSEEIDGGFAEMRMSMVELGRAIMEIEEVRRESAAAATTSLAAVCTSAAAATVIYSGSGRRSSATSTPAMVAEAGEMG